eukprot:scaffold2204_cov106-Isochrysis_galbana.AAC.3
MSGASRRPRKEGTSRVKSDSLRIRRLRKTSKTKMRGPQATCKMSQDYGAPIGRSENSMSRARTIMPPSGSRARGRASQS